MFSKFEFIVGDIKKQGIQNTIIAYTGISIGFVYALVLQPFLLSADELGLVRLLTSISIICGTIFPMGLGSFTLKYFPVFRNPENGHNGYIRLLLLISFVGYLLLLLLMLIFKDNLFDKYRNTPLVIEYFNYVFPISCCIGFVSMITVYCIALFKSSFPSFINEVFLRVANIVVLSLYYFKVVNFNWFMMLYAGCFVIQLLLLLSYMLKIDKGLLYPINKSHLKTLNFKELFSYLAILAPTSVASMALRQIDVALLGSNLNHYSPLKDVAVYTIGFTIGSIIEAPFNSLSKIGDSKITDAIHRNDFRLIEEVYYKSARILMMIGGLIFLGVAVNIETLLSFLPDKYDDSYWVVIIIGFSSYINMSTGLNTSLIYYTDKYRIGAMLMIGMIALSVALNIILIPVYGIYGAAFATSSAMLTYNFTKTYLIWKWFNLHPFKIKYITIALIALVASLGLNYFLPELQNRYFDIAYRSVLVAMLYGGIVLYTHVFPEANGFIKKYFKVTI